MHGRAVYIVKLLLLTFNGLLKFNRFSKVNFSFGGYMREEKSSNIHWHPAFVEAIKMELKEYLDKIEILPEFPLTAEPLKIDCIIIKKTKNLVIKKNIAGIFRDWNIMEYKNPKDNISVNDFHKVYAYACLYSVISNVHVSGITISFVGSRYSKKLIDFLEKTRNYKVEKTSPGIYNVTGDVFAIQIIDSRHLSDDENLWLKSLSGKLNPNAISKVFNEIKKQEETVSLDAYMDVISQANTGFFEEAIEMRRKKERSLTFMEIVMKSKTGKGWIREWKAEARAKARAEGMAKLKAERAKAKAEIAKAEAEKVKAEAEKVKAVAKVARNLKSGGMSDKLVSKYTGLPLAKVSKL
jgi:hypothetical protein